MFSCCSRVVVVLFSCCIRIVDVLYSCCVFDFARVVFVLVVVELLCSRDVVRDDVVIYSCCIRYVRVLDSACNRVVTPLCFRVVPVL